MLKLSIENKVFDISDLNKFQIGDEVIADACATHDRFEGVIVGIELPRLYGSEVLQPDITLLHDGYLTGGFKPSDLRKSSPLSVQPAAAPEGWRPITEADNGIAYIIDAGDLKIGNSYPIWARDAGGRIFECSWTDNGKKAYWWDLEGESTVDPVEFMPHPLDPRFPSSPGKDGGQEVEAVDLHHRIEEVFAWRKTGILPGNALRDMATAIRERSGDVFDQTDALSMAEKQTAEEAMRLVLSRPQPAPSPQSTVYPDRQNPVVSIVENLVECGATPEMILCAVRAAPSTLSATDAVVDRLKKALEPFAEAAASYEPPENDDDHAAWAHDFTIGSLRNARSALATLKAKSPSRDRAASEGWQPIETAPKDGTNIIVAAYCDGSPTVGCGYWPEAGEWFWWHDQEYPLSENEFEARFWMPLPVAPAAEAKGSGQ